MTRAGHSRDRLVVLQSIKALRDTTNPYLVQLVRSLEGEAEVQLFSWRRALFGRWDVLHVHWPELLFLRESRARTIVGAALCTVLVLRMRLTRRALVRTAHNIAPHDHRGVLIDAVLGLLDRATTRWLLLNDSTPVPDGAAREVIPHGHYVDWYARHSVPSPVPRRVLCFGLIRAYKNVPALVHAFTGMEDATSSLHVVGRPDPARLAEELRDAASGDDRVTLSFGYADDERLVREMGEASLVALPYRDLHNSGALLLALSFGRPVLVPENGPTAALAAEVGEAWVRRYTGELTAEVLRAALAEGVPAGTPDLSRRDWATLGAAHLGAYRSALSQLRHERRYSE
ncbi:MAG: hypothetical protein IR160_09320 [Salinibacterium sp.]|nr:glycosyltransferase [Salinibacterium sp.]MBF0672770.1 hypothetical protein [Salinibacterium sp.]